MGKGEETRTIKLKRKATSSMKDDPQPGRWILSS